MGQERGREFFTITVHTDGKRTLRAHCEIDDPPTVLRDVVLSLDSDNYPLDCFVRLTLDDKFEGSGWMRFTDNQRGNGSHSMSMTDVSHSISSWCSASVGWPAIPSLVMAWASRFMILSAAPARCSFPI